MVFKSLDEHQNRLMREASPMSAGIPSAASKVDDLKSKLPMLELEHNGVQISGFDPGERTSGPLALQMLIHSGLLVGGSNDDEPKSPTTPLSPHTPGLTQDIEVLDNACSLGSCTHILACLQEKGLVNVPVGGTLRLTAMETPEDFRPFQNSSSLEQKVARNKWQNVRVMQGHMQVSSKTNSRFGAWLIYMLQSLPWLGPHFTHVLTNINILYSASDDQAIHGKPCLTRMPFIVKRTDYDIHTIPVRAQKSTGVFFPMALPPSPLGNHLVGPTM